MVIANNINLSCFVEKFIYYLVLLCIMQTVSLKLEKNFLNLIEEIMKRNSYSTKTEFIREAIRDKIKDLEKEEALMRLEKIYGAGLKRHKKIIKDEDLHMAGEETVKDLAKGFGVKLD